MKKIKKTSTGELLKVKITTGIEKFSTIFRSALWEEARRHKLSPLQMQILLFIPLHTPSLSNVSHLAKEFAITKATVSDAVRVLVEKGLLRKLNAEDARGYKLALTANGEELVKKLSALGDFFEGFLSKASPEELDKIWMGVVLLLGNLQKTGIIPLRMCFSCQHFGKSHPNGTPHYCHLMQSPLATADLRIDCAEHLEQSPHK